MAFPKKSSGEKKESGRIREADKKRILDDAARKRRARKALEALESDNFQADPHADLKMSKKAPKFEEYMDIMNSGIGRKKKKNKVEQLKRCKKSFNALLEEEQLAIKKTPNYFSAVVPPSKFPEKHFCAICGFPSNYKCVSCGARYCCTKCLGTHQDTRCLKYTA
ncbi:zinc finger HIT domain-containing protein 1 [Octopus bimaculoides]|uniref:HIT-type domain-containing protein n=1 Tax=Octopus bimaculoides TaxID=37653 RepID=A0A0L8FZI3_OCTBM|nr:zinc finger HIT domain-containing protein 1 [Octopus bimaculoides]|eukprot:XP_014785571.1 PREDICTED: zinc finger HIT domain-containing protein 1-like [Octopus bimaculoides]